MTLEEQIFSAFPEVSDEPIINDSFIISNQNLMELEENINYLKYVPSYMLWCIKNKDSELVDEYTINALAEYGRSKSKENTYLNFMHCCSIEQKLVVIQFLEWCKKEIDTTDNNQISRAISNWSN